MAFAASTDEKLDPQNEGFESIRNTIWSQSSWKTLRVITLSQVDKSILSKRWSKEILEDTQVRKSQTSNRHSFWKLIMHRGMWIGNFPPSGHMTLVYVDGNRQTNFLNVSRQSRDLYGLPKFHKTCPGGYCHIWAVWVCAAVKGMIFKQFTLGKGI